MKNARLSISFRLSVAIVCAALSCPSMGAQTVYTLDLCREQVVKQSADVKNASLDISAAKMQKEEALAEYFPTVSAEGMAFYAHNPLVNISITDVLGTSDLAWQLQRQFEDWAAPYSLNTTYTTLKYGYSGSLNLTQPIYAGGRIVNGNRLAALGVKAAQEKGTLQRRTTMENVDKSFFRILALQEKEITLEGLKMLLDTLQKDVESAVKAGLAVRTDLDAVLVKQSELKAGKTKLDMGLRLAKMSLLNDMGVKYNPYSSILTSDLPSLDSFEFIGSFNQLTTPQQAYVDEEKAAASLSETQLLSMQVEAKRLERKMVLGEALPSIGFGATYGYFKYVNQPQWNGAMYAMLKIPLTDWGKNSRKLERMRLEVQKAENQREHLSSMLVLQLRQLFMELSCAYDNMGIAMEAENLAGTRLRQIRTDYKAGLATISDVLLSETSYRNAQEARIEATLDYLTALEAYRLRCE